MASLMTCSTSARIAQISRRSRTGSFATRRGSLLAVYCLRPHAHVPPQYDSLGGPGTGHRHFPEDLGQQFEQQAPKQATKSFECKTTQQCYEEFPYLVHTSVPLNVDDKEPAGLSAQHNTDAGPATGHRRRPSAVDSDSKEHPPPLPHPAAPRDLKKELVLRHNPEQVLHG